MFDCRCVTCDALVMRRATAPTRDYFCGRCLNAFERDGDVANNYPTLTTEAGA